MRYHKTNPLLGCLGKSCAGLEIAPEILMDPTRIREREPTPTPVPAALPDVWAPLPIGWKSPVDYLQKWPHEQFGPVPADINTFIYQNAQHFFDALSGKIYQTVPTNAAGKAWAELFNTTGLSPEYLIAVVKDTQTTVCKLDPKAYPSCTIKITSQVTPADVGAIITVAEDKIIKTAQTAIKPTPKVAPPPPIKKVEPKFPWGLVAGLGAAGLVGWLIWKTAEKKRRR